MRHMLYKFLWSRTPVTKVDALFQLLRAEDWFGKAATRVIASTRGHAV